MARPPLKRVGDQVIALVEGGEPERGCEWVQIILAGNSRMDIVKHARTLGVWSPSISSRARSDLEVVAAIEDERGFVWRTENHAPWRSSSEFLITFRR